MDVTATRDWLKRGTGSEAQVRLELARSLDEIERINRILDIIEISAPSAYHDAVVQAQVDKFEGKQQEQE